LVGGERGGRGPRFHDPNWSRLIQPFLGVPAARMDVTGWPRPAVNGRIPRASGSWVEGLPDRAGLLYLVKTLRFGKIPAQPTFLGKPMAGPQDRLSTGLATYSALVRRYSDRLDLVADSDIDRFESRHIDDSLRALPLIEALPEGPAIDVGSGAGLPGIPLALATPGRLWRLLEPRAKRASFIEEAVRELGLECEVLRLTAEEASRDHRVAAGHVVATARALAPPEIAFAMLLPLIHIGGLAVVWVGESARISSKAQEWEPGIAIMRRESTTLSGGAKSPKPNSMPPNPGA
jgi:16S rRNA (guanine527-N7)-methyltransferase